MSLSLESILFLFIVHIAVSREAVGNRHHCRLRANIRQRIAISSRSVVFVIKENESVDGRLHADDGFTRRFIPFLREFRFYCRRIGSHIVLFLTLRAAAAFFRLIRFPIFVRFVALSRLAGFPCSFVCRGRAFPGSRCAIRLLFSRSIVATGIGSIGTFPGVPNVRLRSG
jgi:hypothetical protein